MDVGRDINDIKEKIALLKKSVQTLKDLRSEKVEVEDWDSFLESTQLIALILKKKNLGEGLYAPNSSKIIKMNFFANFLEIFRNYEKQGLEAEFLTECIAALNAGIKLYEKDLQELQRNALIWLILKS